MSRQPLKIAAVSLGASFALALVFGTSGPFGTSGLSVTNLLRLIGLLAAIRWGLNDSRQLLGDTRRSRVQFGLACIGYAGMALFAAYMAGAIPDYLHGY